MTPTDTRQMIPLAIVVAGALIAGAIYFGGRPAPTTAVAGNTGNSAGAIGAIAAVTTTDHIIGDPTTAKVTIVEYSDLECPFCKVFHNTLHQIVDTYNGQVAWIFRNFPIAQLHSKAPKEAEAAECAASLGGNDVYWKFIDGVFTATNSNNSLDPAQLPKIAGEVGLDVTAFNTCLNSGKFTAKVAADVAAAQKAGAQGTPYTVVIAKDNISSATQKAILTGFANQASAVTFDTSKKNMFTMGGALGQTNIKAAFDALLK